MEEVAWSTIRCCQEYDNLNDLPGAEIVSKVIPAQSKVINFTLLGSLLTEKLEVKQVIVNPSLRPFSYFNVSAIIQSLLLQTQGVS